MLAALLHHPRGRLRLAELAVPPIGADGILIRVLAAGVNPADWKVARGITHREMKRHFPLTPGFDAAGVVMATGPEVTRFDVGDGIYGMLWPDILRNGTYAEYVTATEHMAVDLKPRSITFLEAAALPIPAMTALACMRASRIRRGDRVLVIGASGGIGCYLIQLAAGAGAVVTATCRTSGVALVEQLGASHVVGFAGDHAEELLLSQPHRFDLVVDLVTPYREAGKVSTLVRPGGRFVSTRFAANLEMCSAQGITAENVALRASAADLRDLANLVDSGGLTIPIGEEYPLERAADAFDHSQHGRVVGRIVLRQG